MNVGNTTASVITQHVKQADTAKEQLGTQTVPHLAFLEKQTEAHVQMILEQVVQKEKAERTVNKDPQQKEKRTLRYTVKGKKVTAITEPHIDTRM
jgi:hypothetical protein